METYGSLGKEEKVDFILEQIRLTMAKKDFIRTFIIARKVNIYIEWEGGMGDGLVVGLLWPGVCQAVTCAAGVAASLDGRVAPAPYSTTATTHTHTQNRNTPARR